MKESSSEETAKKTENRGVNVTSGSFSAMETRSRTALGDVKNDLKTVIELMGPDTPKFNYNSSEADNEESVFSSVSGLSSFVQSKKPTTPSAVNQSETDFCISSLSESHATRTDDSKKESLGAQKTSKKREPQPQQCACKLFGENFSAPQLPVPPSPVCVNPNCICVHNIGYMNSQSQAFFKSDHMSRKKEHEDTHRKGYFGKLFKKKKSEDLEAGDLYKVNILQPVNDHSPPRRLVFDLVDGVPKPETSTVGINTVKCSKSGKKCGAFNKSAEIVELCDDTKAQLIAGGVMGSKFRKSPDLNDLSFENDVTATKIDIYTFDHGSYTYFRTTDCPPLIMTEMLAEKTENYTARFWAEFFGTIHIGFAFFTSFILQFTRFVLYGLVRPLTVGLLQLGSDYMLKPLLTVSFNALLQPFCVFGFNLATSLKKLLAPTAESLGFFIREAATLLRAVRLVEVKNGPVQQGDAGRRKKGESDDDGGLNLKCGSPRCVC